VAENIVTVGSEIPIKKIINIAFAIVIMFIMISEVYFYRKLGI
jgi:hypothetical protein